MKILAAAADIGSTIAGIRLRQPLAALSQAQAWPLTLRSFHDCSHADLDAADVLVLQRGTTRRSWRLQQRMQGRGGRVVYELDDLLTAMPLHLLHGAAVSAGRGWTLRALAHADAVSASTERLAAALAPLCRRVVVVPNYAAPFGPFAPFAPRAAPQAARSEAAPLSLVLAASDRVIAAFVVPAIAAAAAARPQRLRLVCIGPAGLGLDTLGLPLQQHPQMPRGDFLALVASLPNPLALIPLDDSAFSACKSAIKFFDLAALGVPALCSNVPPYADVAVDGRTAALLDNTEQAWTAALLRAIDDPAWGQSLADAAMAEVAGRHTLAQTVAAWHDLLSSLAPRRAPPPASNVAMALVDRLARALRAANRARLARRHGR